MSKFKKGDCITYSDGMFDIIGVVIGGDCANVQNFTLGYKDTSDGVIFPTRCAKLLPDSTVQRLKSAGFFQCEHMKRFMVDSVQF